jgi:NAD(P)H-dependent flavin oxidoreductase YrpB (nitropropane dioxygenase family)/DNA-binding MarR family transcriptional regulator
MANKTTRLNKILVRLFHNALKMEEGALRGEGGLSMSEIHTLAEIGAGKPKTMTQVAAGLRISVGALTAAMNKLEGKGYVRRFRVAEDRRIVKVELTEAGAEAAREHDTFHEKLAESAFAQLDGGQQEMLLQMMEKMDGFFRMNLLRPRRAGGDLRLRPIHIGGLPIPVPIFQGDMCAAFSSPALAAAVALNGGVGTLTAVQPGVFEDDYASNPAGANLRAFRRGIIEARRMMDAEAAFGGSCAAGALAVSVPCAAAGYGDFVAAAAEAGAQIIISGAGVPTALPGIAKDAGVKLVPVVSSARAVAVLRRNWAKKYNRAPDAVIFEGPGKCGHLGFKEEHIDMAGEDFYRTLTEIKREIEDLPNCPLIVGNGRMGPGDVSAAIAFGADGVQLEEEFAASAECEAAEGVKAPYLGGWEGETVIVGSPLGMPVRIFRNRLAEMILGGGAPVRRCISCLDSCPKENVPFCLAEAVEAAARGDADNGALFAAGGRAEGPPDDGGKARAERALSVREIFRRLAGP